jgi:hypothetical protein
MACAGATVWNSCAIAGPDASGATGAPHASGIRYSSSAAAGADTRAFFLMPAFV